MQSESASAFAKAHTLSVLKMEAAQQVLGVSNDASPRLLLEAFLAKALQNHPDRGGSAAAWRSTVRAFEQLIDQPAPDAETTTSAPCDARGAALCEGTSSARRCCSSPGEDAERGVVVERPASSARRASAAAAAAGITPRAPVNLPARRGGATAAAMRRDLSCRCASLARRVWSEFSDTEVGINTTSLLSQSVACNCCQGLIVALSEFWNFMRPCFSSGSG
eukprot:TRINITY_DN10939_c0_g1_i1.p2 TRINITY_DN10939_c0_g1~~TRINITY_DN10939_c0_g1_i1.p2  ORF type:complete len:221 (+),score=40.10 TRINITY_DN10939_c0_g1_i1:240-902(+)